MGHAQSAGARTIMNSFKTQGTNMATPSLLSILRISSIKRNDLIDMDVSEENFEWIPISLVRDLSVG